MREADPERFKDKPEIDPPDITIHEREYIDAFYRLTDSRQMGMGVGAIPLSEIYGHADRYYDDPDEYEIFVEVTQAADKAYLSEYNKEQEKKK